VTVRAPAVSENPRVPEIRGRAHRAYRVRDIPEIDAHLRGLQTWLAGRLGDVRVTGKPALMAVERYWADVDALLDVRARYMSEGALRRLDTVS
jgi:hypothetical protein